MELPEPPDGEPNQPETAPEPDQAAGPAPGSAAEANRRRRRRGPRRPRPRREPESSRSESSSDTPLGEAIAKVRAINQTLAELQSDMEEVLELLSKAEAEKIDDEQAIISLRQELDKLQRGPAYSRRSPREPKSTGAANAS